jgi:anti-anti-sigma regulatory factor
MTKVRTETMPSSRARCETVLPRPATENSTIVMSIQWPKFDVALVSVSGHIDAGNSDDFLDYALSRALLCRLLILNLERVSSLSVSGYEALRTLGRQCALADVEFTVLHGTYECNKTTA